VLLTAADGVGRRLSVTVVCGPGFEPARVDRLGRLFGDRCDVRANPPNLPELMVQSDLVVSAGGQTALEAACVGTPGACVEWSWLTAYSRNLHVRGIAFNLGDPTAWPASVAALLDGRDLPALNSLARRAFEVVDGRGRHRLADALVTLAKLTPSVTEMGLT
jgi:hypothetical protein